MTIFIRWRMNLIRVLISIIAGVATLLVLPGMVVCAIVYAITRQGKLKRLIDAVRRRENRTV